MKTVKQIVKIEEEFITLGQFLKHVSVISTGGQAKWYLQEYAVYVDGELENRRGKKLYDGTTIELPNEESIFVIHTHSEVEKT